MARKPPTPNFIPPALTPQQAVERLKAQLLKLSDIGRLSMRDPEYTKWMATTEAVIKNAFGSPNDLIGSFRSPYGAMLVNQPRAYYEHQHQLNLAKKRAILESAIEQLEILAPSAAQVAPGQYQFHPDIERVSGHLFRDGHYKQAAFEAYIRVIEEVKQRSGLTLDGDNLMNQAFGCDGRVPVLKFNTLASEAERDEQKAFMFLFKGIVGLRNSKAHSNKLFNDPHRAHEYLALASLLMRVLELATK